MKRYFLLAGCTAVLVSASTPQAGTTPFLDGDAARRIKADMTFLADDELEGREADTRGYRIAARYVAAQFAQLGLEPMGPGGSFFQPVPMIAYRPVDPAPLRMTDKDGASITLEIGKDFLPGSSPRGGAIPFDAPLVYAQYGIVAPGWKRDDFAGLDVRGKIVVVFSGAPAQGSGDEQAFYGDVANKRAEAEMHGAIGIMVVASPEGEAAYPIASRSARLKNWRMTWRTADGSGFDVGAKAPLLANLGAGFGPTLFAKTGLSWDEAVRRTRNGSWPRAKSDLRLRAAGTLKSETRETLSWNVVARLKGQDGALGNKAVAITAHLDHLGVTETNGQRQIFNGALDNASGVATMLEVARQFRISGQQPKRSVLFVALTAEEKGLVGSAYLAGNPVVANRDLDALVNLDMPILTYDFQDVVAFGAEHSSIGPIVQRVAGGMGLTLSPDPIPEEGAFVRSDHYSFVEQGVPSIFLMTGFKNGGEEKFKNFLANCYHKPCDNLSQPIDYAVAAKFALVNYRIARDLADGGSAPQWNADDFFGSRFARLHR